MSSYIRWMAVFDNHGSEADKSAVSAMFKFKEEYWKPHDTIHGGDNWNFAPLRIGASPEEKEQSMQKDLDAGMSFLKRLHPRYICYGNHDYRLWDLAETGKGVIGDYAQIGVNLIERELDKLGCKTLPYDSRHGILKYANNLSISHGYYHNENAAASMALSYGNIVFGHKHAFLNFRLKSLDERIGQGVGCLCDLNMKFEHARTSKLNKEHGWVYGIKNTKTNMAHYWLARKIDGKWILPTDYVTL